MSERKKWMLSKDCCFVQICLDLLTQLFAHCFLLRDVPPSGVFFLCWKASSQCPSVNGLLVINTLGFVLVWKMPWLWDPFLKLFFFPEYTVLGWQMFSLRTLLILFSVLWISLLLEKSETSLRWFHWKIGLHLWKLLASSLFSVFFTFNLGVYLG